MKNIKSKSVRMERINAEIKKDISIIISNSSIIANTIIGVTNVETTPDLAISTIYLSVYSKTDKQIVLNKIKAKASEIRFALAGKINLRVMPKLIFKLDESAAYGAKIDSILKNIKYSDDGE